LSFFAEIEFEQALVFFVFGDGPDEDFRIVDDRPEFFVAKFQA